MTDQITPVFFRVIRPLFAALLGLTFVQAFEVPQKKVSQVSSQSIVVHIPAG